MQGDVPNYLLDSNQEGDDATFIGWAFYGVRATTGFLLGSSPLGDVFLWGFGRVLLDECPFLGGF